MSQPSRYAYDGVKSNGEKYAGIIEADSLSHARFILRKQGIASQQIKPLRQAWRKQISTHELCIFTRQLATMIEASITIAEALALLAKSQKNKHLAWLIADLKQQIEAGNSLTHALKQHSTYFQPFICNLIDTGEQSGKLAIVLDAAATYQEKIEILKRKIKKILTYPLIVSIMALLVTIVLLVFVVPQFEAMYVSFSAKLPLLTRIVITIARLLAAYGYILGLLLAIGCYGFSYAQKHSPIFRAHVDKLLLNLPIVGQLISKIALARFARNLALTCQAGLPLVKSLQLVALLSNNTVYTKAILKISDTIITGQSLHAAMSMTLVFPTIAVDMIAIGEETGKLEQMLDYVAGYFEKDINASLDNFGAVIEPIIMSFLGLLIGCLVLAIYLPIFKLGSVI